jgi:hypothetical protein
MLAIRFLIMGLLQKIFGAKERKLSKVDYWKKWELFELFDDLHKAEKLLTSGQFDEVSGIEKFNTDFIEELYVIEGENVPDFTRMWIWFSPDKEWDSMIGIKGNELKTRIFRRVDRWKRNQDFLPGTKVFMKNEYGVVLDKPVDNNLVGLIRWDTENENDIEDWRGLFGSFLQAGGKVIDQEYKFKLIDEKGQLKKASR